MNDALLHRYQNLEASRTALFNSLRGYSDDLLNKQPAEGKWSATQVIRHLMHSEDASLRYLQKKTQDLSRAKPTALSGRLKLWFTEFVFMLPVKFKSPEALDPTADRVSLQELETQWADIRRKTFELLTALPADALSKEIWKHIISGKMNAYQMYDFFAFHFARHRGQIERTIRQVNAH